MNCGRKVCCMCALIYQENINKHIHLAPSIKPLSVCQNNDVFHGYHWTFSKFGYQTTCQFVQKDVFRSKRYLTKSLITVGITSKSVCSSLRRSVKYQCRRLCRTKPTTSKKKKLEMQSKIYFLFGGSPVVVFHAVPGGTSQSP